MQAGVNLILLRNTKTMERAWTLSDPVISALDAHQNQLKSLKILNYSSIRGGAQASVFLNDFQVILIWG